jgi:putative ABC transport system permease protein
MIYLKIAKESFIQAWQQLTANKLRSFLSLLGISIGILCVISVKSSVDSLATNIKKSFAKLGNDVVYISKMPWAEDPQDNFWKYARRPNPDMTDFRSLDEKLTSTSGMVFSLFVGRKTIKYTNNSVENCFCVAVTDNYTNFHSLEFEKGRFLSSGEYSTGALKVILGDNIAKQLFGDEIDPIDKEVKLFGKQMIVVGVLKKSGKDLVKLFNFDNCAILGFELARTVANVKSNSPFGGTLQVKASTGVTEQKLKDDVTVALRTSRHLKPSQEDNFAINSMTMFTSKLESFFGVLNGVGYFIGGFSLLVGMFSVANIMFVSVKERTNIIGIKKALGAKRWIILLEFLIESIILCIFGGIMGLLMVEALIYLLAVILDFELFVSLDNIIITILISVIIGILAGIIPAWQAAKMDPVEAIRA